MARRSLGSMITTATTTMTLMVALMMLVASVASQAPALPSGLGACDPLVPQYCAFPWPNNFFAVNDASYVRPPTSTPHMPCPTACVFQRRSIGGDGGDVVAAES